MMRSASSRPKGPAQLDRLRAKIRAIEPRALCTMTSATPVSQGAVAHTLKTSQDAPAKPGLLPAGLHEICPADYLDTPAALAVQAGFMGQNLRHKQADTHDPSGTVPPLVWVRRAGTGGQDFGTPYPLGLKYWGLKPDNILLAEARDMSDALWAMEEALRAGAWVIGEVGLAAQYDLTRSKRLNLAARARGGLALILRSHLAASPSAALSRWRISARPSPAAAWRGATGLPGLGHPRFRAQLERVRGGPPADFDIEWKHATFHVFKPAPLANRTAPDDGVGGAETGMENQRIRHIA